MGPPCSRKAQVVNIDWSIGLGLMVLTLGSAVLIISSFQPIDPDSSLENHANLIHQNMEEETALEGFENRINYVSPEKVEKIPVDRDYSFSDEIDNRSGYIDRGELKIDQDQVLATLDSDNSTERFVYFRSSTSDTEKNYDIEAGSNSLSNSIISLETGDPGITSFQLEGEEILNQTASLTGEDYSTEENGFYGSSLSGDLKVYNSSQEIIIEDGSNMEFDLKNFSELYHDGDTEELDEESTYLDGNVEGFSVGDENLGITFLGDMDATVSKPDTDSVKVEIDSERVRIRAEEGIGDGIERLTASKQGDLFIEGKIPISGVEKDEIEALNDLSQNEFEERLEIETGYNITVEDGDETILERGRNIPFRETASLELNLNRINQTGGFENLDSRVAVWR